MSDRQKRLVWIDLEMTGLDPDRCHILEIASVVTDSELEVVAEGPNLVVHQTPEALETLSDWSRDHFTRSGLLERVAASEVDAAEAEARTLAFLAEHCEKRTAPLCGNSVHTDRSFLWTRMRRLHDFLHYRNVDVSTFKEVLKRWYPAEYDRRPRPASTRPAPTSSSPSRSCATTARVPPTRHRAQAGVVGAPDPHPGTTAGLMAGHRADAFGRGVGRRWREAGAGAARCRPSPRLRPETSYAPEAARGGQRNGSGKGNGAAARHRRHVAAPGVPRGRGTRPRAPVAADRPSERGCGGLGPPQNP